MNNSPSFAARNPDIRKLDKVCRIIAAEFPAVSPTRLYAYDNAFKKGNEYIAEYIKYKEKSSLAMRQAAWKMNDSKEYPYDIYYYLPLYTKKYGMANCSDYTRFAQAILSANNIPSHTFELCDGIRSLDHGVQIVNVPNKNVPYYKNKDLRNLIVVDAWLGFADYASNALRRYQTEFAKFMGLDKEPCRQKLVLMPKCQLDISKESLLKIKETFPGFLFDKN